MLIHVTQEHIDAGIRFDRFKNPIALACKDACEGKFCSVRVLSSLIDNTFYVNPTEVSRRLDEYNHGLGMLPFSFELK